MSELSILQINERRLLERVKREGFREGYREGFREGFRESYRESLEQGVAWQRGMLARQAERRFGAETGRRLAGRLESVSDPAVFEKALDLIAECDDGERLLDGIDGTPRT